MWYEKALSKSESYKDTVKYKARVYVYITSASIFKNTPLVGNKLKTNFTRIRQMLMFSFLFRIERIKRTASNLTQEMKKYACWTKHQPYW